MRCEHAQKFCPWPSAEQSDTNIIHSRIKCSRIIQTYVLQRKSPYDIILKQK